MATALKSVLARRPRIGAQRRPQVTPAASATYHPATDTYPMWTPGRRTILFMSDRAGSFDIYALGVNDTQPKRLTDHPA